MTVLHPGDELSDLLDGRLAPEHAEVIRAHVMGCADCSAELEAVRAIRAAVRSLPAVEPPAGFFESLLEAPDPYDAGPARVGAVLPLRRRVAMANAAAAVAVGLLLVVSGGHGAGAISPEVNGAVQQHAATISAVAADLGGPNPLVAPEDVTPTTLPHRSTDVPRPYVAPDELDGYQLVDAFRSHRGVYLLYEKGRYALSVFEQEGRIDFDRLPEPGERLEVDGDRAWRWVGPRADGRVLVLERNGVIVTLVGDESADAVLGAAKGLPSGARALPIGTRMRRACGDALDSLSPAG